MLVLSRKKSEYIDIALPDGQKIEICVVDILFPPGTSSRVKLGINAPKELPVHRREVRERIEQDKVKEKVE